MQVRTDSTRMGRPVFLDLRQLTDTWRGMSCSRVLQSSIRVEPTGLYEAVMRVEQLILHQRCSCFVL